ncbi:hypothetical protein TTHERM_000478091 (macronuclear) [Tetrahymena thermophila SB210]|uniref:Uncharacterized protein n=1 Tax=Tetrahymena thermophila (strain SB210) TaxID=312017 RepID=W7XC47_TETTS|nr:hypothetical protein TTHERM_000478091 [Tetrahymena thermophila SB210]EWS74063.1 hypothetical protein TTHERM_000478091 [Tetrahymena thermophila SB210]|eukprot:XP_012653396.1 hypothetical protein TTHERM_000478091 [Tetrahymena thermophila SB210]
MTIKIPVIMILIRAPLKKSLLKSIDQINLKSLDETLSSKSILQLYKLLLGYVQVEFQESFEPNGLVNYDPYANNNVLTVCTPNEAI